MFAATMLLGCKKDDGPSGSVEISIPGMDGNYNKPSVQMQYYGETGISGVYATRFNIVVNSSDNPDDILVMRIDVFHYSKSFKPGSYTFPSTGEGTAAGSFFTSRSSGSDFSGTAVSGQVSIAVSGESYTVTFNDVSMKMVGDGTNTVSFVYNGKVEYVDVSGRGETINPEYPGSSTIKETFSDATFPYMRIDARYIDYSQHGVSIPSYSVALTSMENGGVVLRVNLQTFSNTRDMKGLYFATILDGAGTIDRFIGHIILEGNGERRSKPIAGGHIFIAESNGVYTVTLYDVTDGGYGYKESVKVHGAYTGICNFLK